MPVSDSYIIAIANQKGGVGKTTTTINLAQALALRNHKVLIIDTDPQGNSTKGLGIDLETIPATVGNLIRDRNFPLESVIYKGNGFDIIPASPALEQVAREMVGRTNSELRLAQRLRPLRSHYSFILIDSPPNFGPLLNSSLNAADSLIVPVDSNYFAVLGIKELLAEVTEIQTGTNPNLSILGFLLTLADHTNITHQTFETLRENFGEKVFNTKIRRSVRLREAPTLGKTIFHYAPDSTGAHDYMNLGQEVLVRLGYVSVPFSSSAPQGGHHE